MKGAGSPVTHDGFIGKLILPESFWPGQDHKEGVVQYSVSRQAGSFQRPDCGYAGITCSLIIEVRRRVTAQLSVHNLHRPAGHNHRG